MSMLARRLVTCVPQEIASSRRASCGALEITPSFLHPDVVVSPSAGETSSPQHGGSPLLYSGTTLLPLPGNTILKRIRRSSIGPSDVQLEEPSLEYLCRKRASLDPTWLSPSPNPKNEPMRSRVLAVGLTGNSLLELASPGSLYNPEGISTPHRDSTFIRAREPQHLPLSPLTRRQHTLQQGTTLTPLLQQHTLQQGTTLTPLLQRRQPCGSITISPSADFLGSPKVTEGCAWRSPSNVVCPSLSPCLEHSPVNTHFTFLLREQKDVEEEEEKRVGKKRREASLEHRGKCLVVPRITMDLSETSPTVPPHELGSLEPFPARRGLRPTMAAAYHHLQHTVSTPRVAENTSSKTPQHTHPRRASWHVYPTEMIGALPHTRIISESSCDHSCRYSPVVASLTHGARCQALQASPRVGKIIGRGGFGTVKVGCFRGVKVAVKVLRGGRAAASWSREAHALSLAPHAHLASTHAIVTPSPTPGYARIAWAAACLKDVEKKEKILSIEEVVSMFCLPLEDASCPVNDGEEQGGRGRKVGWAWVVSELYTPHTLLTLINDPTMELRIRSKIRYTYELASGLAYLHSRGLAHLDVKPANALLTTHGHLRLADFGCCARLDQTEELVLGTVGYQAPEVLRGEAGDTYSDVFSLGVTIWHLYTQTSPYQGLHPHVVLYQVAFLHHRPTDHHEWRCAPSTTLEDLLWHLAESCWVEKPQNRPSASSVCKKLTALHPNPAP